MVASARSTPPENKHPLATHAPDPARRVATSRLNCCSLMPWTAGTLPSVSTIAMATANGGNRQHSARSQSKTLPAVSPIEKPPKNDLDIVKRKFDQGRQDEHHIYRVRKPLLVLRVIGTRSIEQPPVISLLSFKVDLPAVGIASM